MINYNPIYQKFINDKNRIPPTKMERGKFYQIKKYKYVCIIELYPCNLLIQRHACCKVDNDCPGV